MVNTYKQLTEIILYQKILKVADPYKTSIYEIHYKVASRLL